MTIVNGNANISLLLFSNVQRSILKMVQYCHSNGNNLRCGGAKAFFDGYASAGSAPVRRCESAHFSMYSMHAFSTAKNLSMYGPLYGVCHFFTLLLEQLQQLSKLSRQTL